MSIHFSLKDRKQKRRSVLKRYERLAKAIKEEKWQSGMSVFALPKFNSPKIRKKRIKSDEEEVKTTTIGKVDILEQHKLTKELKEKKRKQGKEKKETTGRK